MKSAANDTTTAVRESVPVTSPDTTTSNDGKWTTFHRHAGLMRYEPSGAYFVRLKVDGKVKRQSLETETFKVAKERLKDAKDRLRSLKAEADTFGKAAQLYLADIESNHVLADKTKEFYNARVKGLKESWPGQEKNDVKKGEYLLDKVKLSKITEKDCREWAASFSSKFSASNFNNTLSVLREILERGGLSRDYNPAYGTKHGKKWRVGVNPKKLVLPEPGEFEKIVDAIRTAGARQSRECANLVEFLAFSGCRISEARQVLWMHVDMERGVIRVANAKISKASKKDTFREVPIIPPMRQLLERMRIEQQPTPEQRVCVLSDCEKSLTNACRKVGVARITHHDLRHMFATRCIESGVDVPTVSRWLGHSDGGALAMKVYGHLRREHSQQAAQKVTFGVAPLPENVTPLSEAAQVGTLQ